MYRELKRTWAISFFSLGPLYFMSFNDLCLIFQEMRTGRREEEEEEEEEREPRTRAREIDIIDVCISLNAERGSFIGKRSLLLALSTWL